MAREYSRSIPSLFPLSGIANAGGKRTLDAEERRGFLLALYELIGEKALADRQRRSDRPRRGVLARRAIDRGR